MHITCTLLLLLVAFVVVEAAQSSGRSGSKISNVQPRRDKKTGEILPISDGCVLDHNGTLYLYGVHYQPCPVSEQSNCYRTCGFYNMTFSVATASSVAAAGNNEWSLANDNILPIMTDHGSHLSSRHLAYFEPSVVFNPVTRKFVMWFHFNFSLRAVASSDSPLGPFTIVTMPEQNGLPSHLQRGSGFYVWQDDDDTPTPTLYAKFNIILRDQQTGDAQFVGRMAPDYLSIVEIQPVHWNCEPAAHSDPLGRNSKCFQEGGGIFKSPIPFSGQRYAWFVLGGNGCCFCALGGDSKVWRSLTGPMGPYQHIGYLNAPKPNPPNSTYTPYEVPAQQFGVQKIHNNNGSYTPLYTGMRWGSAPDKRKDHDFQYWAPIEVQSDGLSLKRLVWENEIVL